ncbi:MAG: hypothetical protein Q9201_003410 [Fulgogasparrea decipioides]
MTVFASPNDVLAELETAQNRLGVPASARVYISTFGCDACVTNGQPSRLLHLKRHSTFLQETQTQDPPLVGLWHSPHLYSKNEALQILEPFKSVLDETPPPCQTSVSQATGKAIQAATAQNLFTHTIGDILCAPSQWHLLEQGLPDHLSETMGRSAMLSFEFSKMTRSLLFATEPHSGRQPALQDLASWCPPANVQQQGHYKSANIAIVGMSCRFPDADDAEALWSLLEQGRDTCKRVPKDRFDADTHYDARGKKNNASHTPYGCFIEQPGLFDPRFFNMSPRETTQTDPMHRLALVTAYEALEMSGFVLNSTPTTQQDRIGTFYGQTSDDWREVNAAQKIETEEDALADKDNILGIILASGTNHSADAISITHPHSGNQAHLYQSILHTAGVDPLDVSYVELHGTGTQAGDTNEMESVTEVFAPIGSKSRGSEQALYIGSVKSNVGHGGAAAGITALIKVFLMMQKNAIPPHIGIKTPQVAFVFTGQGSFYPSLGRRLFEFSALFRLEISHLNEVALGQNLPSFLPAIEGSLDEEHKLSALVTQLALVCVQMALVRLWGSWGIRPSVVIGHSLGEYAALYTAGVLSRDDTIHLVGHRACLLEERCTPGTHIMLAIKASTAEIAAFNKQVFYEVACINAPGETVICGNADQMDKSTQNLRQAGFKCLAMDLPYAFHSTQIDPIMTEFKEHARAAIFNKPTIPVVSTSLSRVVRTGGGVFDAEYLSHHARKPVNLVGAVQAATDARLFTPRTAFVEIGAHPVCTTMIKMTLESDSLGVPSLHKAEDAWKALSKSLCLLYSTGLSIDWRQFHYEYDSSHELLDLPAYSFDNKNYWIDYVNDWCLNKTEPRNGHADTHVESRQQASKLSTSSVHRIVFEEFEDNAGKVIVQSDLCHPMLRKAVMRHRVNGAGLCPSSIYADVAMTLGDYVYQQLKPRPSNIHVQCGEMEVVKPLIMNEHNNAPRILQVAIKADLDKHQAQLQYANVDGQGKETLLHATCVVTFEDGLTWLANWASTAYLICGRIDKADQISRGLAYKMFAGLVQYDKAYQGMENVILDSANFQATSRVSFQTDEPLLD